MDPVTRTLPAAAETVPVARRFVRQALIDFDAPGACDDAESLVSELATNAVLHARTEYTIGVARDGAVIRVRVQDLSAVLPRQRVYDADSTTGRGVRLLASISSNWGIEPLDTGKAVWFELPVDGATTTIPWDDSVDIESLLASFDDPADGHGPGVMARAA